jgi:type II secretory pathway pseudopilin PulG
VPLSTKVEGLNAKCQLLIARHRNPMLRRFQFRRANGHGQTQQGYILLTLLLFIALLTIFAAAIVPSLTQQIKRDREEELIHRGVEYSRAVRHYYKKFGRYPTRIEDLQSTNAVRFLRKRYKDPITGKDFKLLHQGEVQMSFGSGLQGGAGLNALGTNAGITQNGQGLATAVAAAAAAAQPAAATGAGTADADSADSNSASSSSTPTGPGTSPGSASSSNNPSGQVFGGGPIVGVVSTSKDASIRSFNKKDHYNQWQFIYDPSTDRGGLLMTPNQPPLNINANGQTGNGQPGTGQPGSGGLSNQSTSPGTSPTQPQPGTQQ